MFANIFTKENILSASCAVLLVLCWVVVMFLLNKTIYKGHAGLVTGSGWVATSITFVIAFVVWKVFQLLSIQL